MQIDDFLNNLDNVGTKTTIGYTTLGEPIPMLSKGKKRAGGVLLIGSVHAREYITSYLLLELFKEYSGDYPVDLVPMLNIDGVRLVTGGLNALTLKVRDRLALLRLNDGSTDFSKWKANVRGVDLNVNCDADWGSGKSNIKYPAPENYIGPCPFSENESYAVKRLIDSNDYALAVCYHSKGEEVYYGFKDNRKYKKEAERVSKALDYKLKLTPRSTGGIKDYFTLSTTRLGLTVEVGSDALSHPIGLDQLSNLYSRHKGILELYAEIAKELWIKYGS